MDRVPLALIAASALMAQAGCPSGPSPPDVDGDNIPDPEDCAPTDPLRGGEEVCDGRDNDCDGVRDNVPHAGVLPTGEVALEDVAWATLVGEVAWDTAGTFVASAGDVDADGYGDLLIGTDVGSLDAPDPWRTSRTYLVYGPVCGEVSLALEPEGVSGAVLAAGKATVSYLGDVNDDGFDDVRIGPYIFFGPVYGELDASDADIWLTGWGTWTGRKPTEFGADLNDDGFGDLIVGDNISPMVLDETEGWAWGPGRVVVFYGPLVPGELDLNNPDVHIVGDSLAVTGASTGWAVTSPGDLDGDGSDDLVIGSWNSPGGNGPDARHGRVDVFYGPLSGAIDLGADSDATITHSIAHMRFGSDVAGVGDIDGDGLVEFAVGTGHYLDPALRVFGAVQGTLDESAAELEFDKGATQRASTIVSGFDFDGDGDGDLALSSHYPVEGSSNWTQGARIYGTTGTLDLLPGSATVKAVAGADDFSGDGAPDLLLGLPGWSTDQTAVGSVVVILGTAATSR